MSKVMEHRTGRTSLSLTRRRKCRSPICKFQSLACKIHLSAFVSSQLLSTMRLNATSPVTQQLDFLAGSSKSALRSANRAAAGSENLILSVRNLAVMVADVYVNFIVAKCSRFPQMLASPIRAAACCQVATALLISSSAYTCASR